MTKGFREYRSDARDERARVSVREKAILRALLFGLLEKGKKRRRFHL